tara:strand:- start:8164 stop:9027 length:864 start_codon:yes stop_codon:yes gene_type:complete
MEKIKSIEKTLLNKRVAIISHDSGGAEILSSFVKLYRAKYSYTVSGPAINIFKNKVNNFKILPLKQNVDNSDIIITGTGLGSDLEYKAIVYSKKKDKLVYSYLDHWVNYRKRFIRDKKLELPDEIWVGDKYAKKIASKLFDNVKFVPNPYWSLTIKQFKKIKKKINSNNIIFVSSNSNRLKVKKSRDLVIFKKFLDFVKKKKINNKIIIRKHPTEKNNKFNSKIYKKTNIKLDVNKSLTSSMCNCSMIFGHNTMALVIGKLCGLKTFHINVSEKISIPRQFIDQIVK